MPKETFKYTNGEITVIWKPHVCIHSKKCWTNLRAVFDPFVKPWINMQGATTNPNTPNTVLLYTSDAADE